MEQETYTGKELAKMIYELKEELAKTTTLIRGYNGLREAQNDFSDRLQKVEQCLIDKKDNVKNYQWILGWLIGLAGLLFGILK